MSKFLDMTQQGTQVKHMYIQQQKKTQNMIQNQSICYINNNK